MPSISQYTVTTTAIEVANYSIDGAGTSATVTIRNIGNETVWIGSSSSTANSSGGFPVVGSGSATFDFPGGSSGILWATCAASSVVSVETP